MPRNLSRYLLLLSLAILYAPIAEARQIPHASTVILAYLETAFGNFLFLFVAILLAPLLWRLFVNKNLTPAEVRTDPFVRSKARWFYVTSFISFYALFLWQASVFGVGVSVWKIHACRETENLYPLALLKEGAAMTAFWALPFASLYLLAKIWVPKWWKIYFSRFCLLWSWLAVPLLFLSLNWREMPPLLLSYPDSMPATGLGSRGTAYNDKPVIYLYPTEASSVTVKLSYKGTFTFTYPEYQRELGGWKVHATPSGVLHDQDGAEYSYLFWEGAPAYQVPYDCLTAGL